MKYIKDRFYNSRKRSPSLGAPVHNLFTCEERTAFSCGLWVQRYNKFLKPPNIRRSFFLRASSELETLLRNSKATEERNPQSHLPYISPETVSDTSNQSDRQARSETPLFWVANAKVQQLFESAKYSEKFFFESLACASYTYLYIGAPKSQRLLYYNVISASIWNLNKRGYRTTLYPSKLAHHSRISKHLRRSVLLSCECKDTTTFWNHQIFSKLFSPNATPRKHGIRKQEG